MRPILPWNFPIGGRCAQAHTVPRVQARPDAFLKWPFPHIFHDLGVRTTAGHCNSRDFPRDASSQKPALIAENYHMFFSQVFSNSFLSYHCPVNSRFVDNSDKLSIFNFFLFA